MTTELHSIPADAQAIIDTALRSAAPHRLETGHVHAFHTPAGVHKVDLTGDEYRTAPARKTGTTRVWDVPSFFEYFGKHCDEHSEVYADAQRLAVTAVLDAHRPDAARWGGHRLVLELRKTPEWQAWMAHHGRLLSQTEFAEHLEDHCAELVAPPAAEMLEVAQSIQAATKVDFKSGTRLASGQRQLEYVETVQARAGQKGQLTIPDTFEIGLVPFEGSAPYRVTARFRYRIEGEGQLKLGYRLDRPDNVLRAAFDDVVGDLQSRIDYQVMNGAPS
ncbi:uncharacterized protein YfdQ (DUF2303 family) [Streptacidiphilus sp. MAP12-33]|uniref:YfdQ family protein n=1 Tax=Streptacidiphilus sp. MAP12-33 TaxID=3156266 RepID=UPI0035160844